MDEREDLWPFPFSDHPLPFQPNRCFKDYLEDPNDYYEDFDPDYFQPLGTYTVIHSHLEDPFYAFSEKTTTNGINMINHFRE